jgi:16S rRNA (guanine966-N2)-methyltransferase
MRIISGYLKGKKLELPKDKLTRPLKDMVKESIFNILSHSKNINIDLTNSIILDLFSGSGSFGLECISRGAKYVYFNENYQKALEVLQKNIQNLKCEDKCTILSGSCFDLDIHFKKNANIVFLDPPFKEKDINKILNTILENKILNKNGIIIIHRNKKIIDNFTTKLNIAEVRNYGLSKIIFGN